jgi:hypothetical protein
VDVQVMVTLAGKIIPVKMRIISKFPVKSDEVPQKTNSPLNRGNMEPKIKMDKKLMKTRLAAKIEKIKKDRMLLPKRKSPKNNSLLTFCIEGSVVEPTKR